jgi:hypothetical protein
MYNTEFDVKEAKASYEYLYSQYADFINQVDDEEFVTMLWERLGVSLGELVEKYLQIDKDQFVYEAVQELHDLLDAESVHINVGEVLYLKLGHIFGSEDSQILEIYARSKILH